MLGFFTDGWSLVAVSYCNFFLAAVAATVHGWAAYNTSGHLRRMFLTIAGLASFYSISYLWLALNPERVSDWSNALRPIGIFTWVIAWAIEPVILVAYLKKRGRQIVEHAQAVADKADEKLGN